MMHGSSSNNAAAHHYRRRELGDRGRAASNSGSVPMIVPDDATNVFGGDDNIDRGHQRHRSLSSSSMSMGTIMYMDGFHWALFPPSDSPPLPCLNLFYPSWTLQTPTRFVLAMASVTSIGMLVEACGVWRVRCLRRGRARRAAERAVAVVPGSSARLPSSCARRCDLLAALLHASRIWLGYLLMLAVMSYAVEFLLSAVLGVVLGRYCFMDADGGGDAVGVGGGIGGMGQIDDGGGRRGDSPSVDAMVAQRGNGETWGGGDPCCDYDDDVDVREPLLSSIALGNNGGVTRRSVA